MLCAHTISQTFIFKILFCFLAEDMIGQHFPDNAPVVLYRLRKDYPSPSGGPPYVAVHSVSVAIEKNECFGLLGPNGKHP